MKKKLYLLIGLMIVSGILLFYPYLIEMNGSKEVTIEVYSEYTDPGASLRIDGNLKTSGKVDTDIVGDYKITYSYYTQKKTRIVHVVDTTAPVIELEGEDEVEVLLDHTYRESGYTVSDNYDQDIEVKSTNNIDTSKLGDYTVEYSSEDSSGNKGTAQRIVHVVEDDYHYEGVITDQAGIPSEVSDVIVDFYNRYYRSIKYLEPVSFKGLYNDSYQQSIMEYAVSYLINARKKSINDLFLEDCHYDLTYSSVNYSNNAYTITIYEEAYLNFRFIMNTTSRLGGIYNQITIVRSNDHYYISNFEKEEGWYSIFKEEGDQNRNLQNLYDQCLDTLDTQLVSYEQDRQNVISGKDTYEMQTANAYDREAAVAYAQEYWHTRNPDYSSFESNCMNFGSQCLVAGGIPMDYTGSYYEQWKYYSSKYDTNEEADGFLYTWTFIPYFRQYAANNTSTGLIASLDVNIYLAEGGDLIQIGSNSEDNLVHNMIVVDTIKNENGEIVDILCNGNTNDMQNFPLSAGAYPYKVLIKIAGYN